jgi:peptide/nickel transport system substrate-binding protein
MRRLGSAAPVAAALAVVLVLAACGGGGGAQRQQGGRSGGTFTYDTYTQVMVGWDPATSYSNEIIAMSNMYEGLTRYDSVSKQVKPLLASSWSSSSDGLTWTFHLQHGVKFHTGRPMTAEAAKAALERTIQLGQSASYIWDPVDKIDTPDSSTLAFHLKYPAPLPLLASADYAAYIYDTQAASGDLAAWFGQGNDAGTGPYTVGSWQKGQETELVLKQFPSYWKGWSGAHYTRMVFRVVPQDTTAAQLLRSGEVSFVEQLNASLWSSFKGDANVNVVSTASWQNLIGFLNTQAGPLADPAVRQAVSYAIDYQGIVSALKGSATGSSGVVPPGLWGHFDDLPVYKHDQTKAQQLLKQAGYGPGGKPLKLTLTYTDGDTNEQLASTLMKSDLAKLNIDLQPQGLAWPTQWDKAKSANPADRQDVLLMYWWPDYADPYSWFINLYHCQNPPNFNLSYYCDSQLDSTMASAEKAAASDRSRAADLYRQMQVKLLHEAPTVFLMNENYQYAVLKSVGNLVVNPAYPNVVFAYDLKPS